MWTCYIVARGYAVEDHMKLGACSVEINAMTLINVLTSGCWRSKGRTSYTKGLHEALRPQVGNQGHAVKYRDWYRDPTSDFGTTRAVGTNHIKLAP